MTLVTVTAGLSREAFEAELREIEQCGDSGTDYSDRAYAVWRHDRLRFAELARPGRGAS